MAASAESAVGRRSSRRTATPRWRISGMSRGRSLLVPSHMRGMLFPTAASAPASSHRPNWNSLKSLARWRHRPPVPLPSCTKRGQAKAWRREKCGSSSAPRRGFVRCIARPCQNDDVRSMTRPVASLLVAALILTAAGPGRAEAPEAGGRERHAYLARAGKEFEAGRFEQALVSFEAAARLSEEPLPDEALRRWGISASEAGWPLAAYVRLRQYMIAMPGAAGR